MSAGLSQPTPIIFNIGVGLPNTADTNNDYWYRLASTDIKNA
jgi:hypothetical protein